MKIILKNRYYCDHCKKSTGTKPSMVKHEKGCTLRPDRECSMCALMGEVQLSMPELQAAYAKGFKALREACHNCPACTLATERQFGIDRQWDEGFGFDHPANTERGDWEFRADCKEFWVRHNENKEPY
jgi:hypothetical protein